MNVTDGIRELNEVRRVSVGASYFVGKSIKCNAEKWGKKPPLNVYLLKVEIVSLFLLLLLFDVVVIWVSNDSNEPRVECANIVAVFATKNINKKLLIHAFKYFFDFELMLIFEENEKLTGKISTQNIKCDIEI